MSVTPAEPTPTPSEPSAAAPAPTPTPPATPAATEPPKAPEPNASPWADPAAAEAEIKRLRAENAKDRTAAKAQAAEEARKELAASFGKILNPEAPETDPAKLTESLTAAQAEAKQARVELAVHRNAAAAGGNPAALLRDTSLLKSLDAIDPNDGAAIQAAIQSAIEAAPWLGAAPAEPRPPAPNPAQGSSSSGPSGTPQLTEADVKRLSAEGKHAEIVKAREEGRLRDYLAS